MYTFEEIERALTHVTVLTTLLQNIRGLSDQHVGEYLIEIVEDSFENRPICCFPLMAHIQHIFDFR